MRYDRPELAERLAADYVLGTMPRRARWRFERLIGRDATLAARVARWGERLRPLDSDDEDESPPARVWRALERQIGFEADAPMATARRWLAFMASWRGFGAVAAAACVGVALYVAVDRGALPKVATEVADRTGLSGWIAAAPPRAANIGLSVVQLRVGERERPRWLRAALLLTANGQLTVTVEPPPSQH